MKRIKKHFFVDLSIISSKLNLFLSCFRKFHNLFFELVVPTSRKKIDEFAEAARLLPGPAGQPECVWLGRRVVNLLWRDDLDTAF